MFKWLNKQCVESDGGFIVASRGRFTIEYRERGGIITVYVEHGLKEGGPCVIVGSDAFARWDGDPPRTTTPLVEQKRMLANFTAAMEFQGMAVVVG
jgi:hypothetical protein